MLAGGITRLTLRRVTRSAAWSSVRADMSSTILCRAGSEGVGPVPAELGAGELVLLESDGRAAAGGGGGDDDDALVVVAVASVRARTNDSVLLLCAETLCGMDRGFVSEHIRTFWEK